MNSGKVSLQTITRGSDGTITKTTDSGVLMQEFNNIVTELKEKNPNLSDQQILASAIDSLRGRKKLKDNETINFVDLASGNPAGDQALASLGASVFGTGPIRPPNPVK